MPDDCAQLAACDAESQKGRQMRWVVCALLFLGCASRASAADLDILRGSEPVGLGTFTNWTGIYVGGQIGYGSASGDFSNATSSIVAEALRVTTLESEFDPSSWQVLGTANNQSEMYGGFFGYNSQWQNLMLGVEGNLVATKFSLVAPITPIGRITPADSNGIPWTVVFTGSGSTNELDYGELRGRAGLILGNFLPYGFVGFAMGEASFSVNANGYAEGNAPTSGTCSIANTPPCYLITFDKTNTQSSLVYGGAVGAGMDVALTQNIFIRGEFEYLRFVPIDNIVLAVTSARVGAGLKF
jgi:outer membrane immunogenic protein